MKNAVLFVILGILLSTASANARVLKAKALEEISTTSPREVISVKTLRSFSLDDDVQLQKGYVLTGRMLNIKEPGKWHQNASFTFIPTSYTDNKGNTHQITKEIRATYRQKMKPDFKHSEITVGNFMFSPAYVDDAKKIIEGEGKEVFEEYANRTTPWGQGDQIDIKAGEKLYFNFPK